MGTATVTVEVQGKTDTFTINVVHGTPTLTLGGEGLTVTEDGGTMEAMQGTALDLPTAVAFADGANITDSISITYSDETKLNISGGKMTPEVGEYTVTYTVANPDDASKSVTKIVTITVYRTIFSWTDNMEK